VLHAVEYLEAFGFEATVLPVDAYGLLRPDDQRAALRPDTVLASIHNGHRAIGRACEEDQLRARRVVLQQHAGRRLRRRGAAVVDIMRCI